MQHLRRWVDTVLRRFPGRQDGQVAITFGLCLVPLTFMVGAALDYSGANDLKARLQRATDGANLQLCQIPGTPTQTQLEQSAQTYMAGLMASTSFSVDHVVYTPSPRKIELVTSSIFSTAVVRAFSENFRTMRVGASSQCFGQPQTFEIALVLDNTWSMTESSGGQSKLAALKAAATNFVNSIFSNASLGPNTKMSLVPFAAGVAVSPTANRNATWIDQTGGASYHWNFIKGGATAAKAAFNPINVKSRLDLFDYLHAKAPSVSWNGCFESLPYPLNTQDVAPTSSNPDSYYVPMFGQDELGKGGSYTNYSANSWIDDDGGTACATTTDTPTLAGQACKYVSPKGAAANSTPPIPLGPNQTCTSRPLTRLTTGQPTLLNEINAMVANGETNIHEGLMWGWRTLSPNSVFADGASYTKQYNNKILVLMTDGMNTWLPNPYNGLSTYSAYGFYTNADGSKPNNRLPAANANPSNDTQTRAAMDALTLAGCRNAVAAGVTIYTIGFSVASDPIDQQGINMLQSCAGSASRAFVANDSSSIVSIFQQIAANIGSVRLTQ